MAILKSRFGKDGIVFEDVTFDNGRVVINISEDNLMGNTFYETKEIKNQRDQNRVAELLTNRNNNTH